MKTFCMTVLAAIATLVTAGCGSPAPDKIEKVTVRYYNPFPPEREQKAESFDLNEQELDTFRRLCPDLGKTEGPGCDSVYPPFSFCVQYEGGKTVRAQFCCGSIRTFSPDGNLDAPKELREHLVKAIESRAGELDWGRAR